MDKPRVAFIPIARTTFDMVLAEEEAGKARNHLTQLPLQLEGPVELITDLQGVEAAVDTLAGSPPDLLLIFQSTFADSTMVMLLAEAVDAPVLLWAVPEAHTGGRLRLNSYCGINLAGHALTRAGYEYGHIFARPDDPAVVDEVMRYAKAGHARSVLRGSHLGRVGENPDGFETCLLNPDRLQETFGLKVVQFDLENEIFPLANQVKPDRVDQILDRLENKVSGVHDLDEAPTRGTLQVYAALQQLALEKGLGGYAVRCWPEFFTELGCAACGAMSMLSDDGIPCSCEADVNGTITQMLLQSIGGEPAFGTDMVSLDEERDALVVWHCGLAPLSMADPGSAPGVTVHSNRKLPLLFEFTLKPGPVTLARLSEASGDYRLVIGRGEVTSGPKSFSGTSGLVKFDRPAREVMELILKEGLEHHISLTYGDHTDVLATFAQIMKLPILQLTR